MVRFVTPRHPIRVVSARAHQVRPTATRIVAREPHPRPTVGKPVAVRHQAPLFPRELKQVVLEGQYVRLEPLRLEHAEELWPVAQEKGLFDHLSPGAGDSLGNLRSWIFRRLAEESVDKAEPFLVREPDTRKAIGSTSYLNIDVRHKRVEVGDTWIGKSHRRTAANTETKLLMLQHAFEDWKAIRVQFKADARNARAQKALARIGAVKEGVMRNERILADGFVRDAVVYSITDREWPEVKKRLNTFLWHR